MSPEVLVELVNAHTLTLVELEYRRWPAEFASHAPPFPRPLGLREVADAQLYEALAVLDDLLERGEDEDVRRWAAHLRETGRLVHPDELGDEEEA